MKRIYHLYQKSATSLRNFTLLLVRIVLAYGFFTPAIMKWKNLETTAEWFEGMGYPLPLISVLLAATTELSGVVLLVLGFGTRIISVLLIIVLLVAIFTVHSGNGFEAGNNGYEIPLYYILMNLTLIAFGAGKYSMDRIFGYSANDQ